MQQYASMFTNFSLWGLYINASSVKYWFFGKNIIFLYLMERNKYFKCCVNITPSFLFLYVSYFNNYNCRIHYFCGTHVRSVFLIIIHKEQGLFFNFIGVNLWLSVFVHGMLDVNFSSTQRQKVWKMHPRRKYLLENGNAECKRILKPLGKKNIYR